MSNESVNQPLPKSFRRLSDTDLADLSRRLKPPQSNKSPGLRPIHPDLVVLALSLFVPFFLVKIYQTQPATILPVILLLALLSGVYIWRRVGILHAYKMEETRYREKESQNQRALQRWMDLHFCICDDIVFVPMKDQYYPVDQMAYYLNLN